MRRVGDQSKLEDHAELLFHEQVLPLYAGCLGQTPVQKNIARVKFFLSLLAREKPVQPGVHLVDLGGGLSPWPVLMRALGLRVTVIDDFAGGGGVEPGEEEMCQTLLTRFRAAGVSIVTQDLLTEPLPCAAETVDVVACFHALEHFHHSPRQLFTEVRRILKPDGIVIVATPNSVNLRKRLSVLWGNTNLCSLDEWYDTEGPFRGHVREPTLEELKTLLTRNGFAVQTAAGRNFLGQDSLITGPRGSTRGTRLLWSVLDRLLRVVPTLCSDLHVVGKKA